MTPGTERDRRRGPMEGAGGRMSSLGTGAIGDDLIRPGPGVPTVRPGGECARPALPQRPDRERPASWPVPARGSPPEQETQAPK